MGKKKEGIRKEVVAVGKEKSEKRRGKRKLNLDWKVFFSNAIKYRKLSFVTELSEQCILKLLYGIFARRCLSEYYIQLCIYLLDLSLGRCSLGTCSCQNRLAAHGKYAVSMCCGHCALLINADSVPPCGCG